MRNFKKIKSYPPIEQKVKEIISKKFPEIDLDLGSYETFMDFIYSNRDKFTDLQMLYFQIFSCKLDMVETEHFVKIEDYIIYRTSLFIGKNLPKDLEFYICNI